MFVKIELVFGLGKVLSLSVDLACILNVYALFIAVLWAAIRIWRRDISFFWPWLHPCGHIYGLSIGSGSGQADFAYSRVNYRCQVCVRQQFKLAKHGRFWALRHEFQKCPVFWSANFLIKERLQLLQTTPNFILLHAKVYHRRLWMLSTSKTSVE